MSGRAGDQLTEQTIHPGLTGKRGSAAQQGHGPGNGRGLVSSRCSVDQQRGIRDDSGRMVAAMRAAASPLLSFGSPGIGPSLAG